MFGSTGRAATKSEPPSKGRTIKLAALRTMSALALTFVPQECGISAPASAACLRRVVDDWLNRLDPPYFGAEVPVNDGGSYHVTGRSERGRWPLDRATGNSARVFLEQCRFEYRKPCRSLSVMQVWP
ncbi:hypothetical protein GOC91_16790 [Sinorhizobium medicae]|nr:hypothetical protein [Sinorhizobium medicae]MDX0456646.1 hypothetical protein [Sinorhizobium medicae]MDX0520793.1 hypothetical protein [Sinorhizobium medicae]MDX0549472.1 hypothetical protein [Sinorhizobium medicae]MDX0583240.1 hypothetical protein [Sinorhizobium medicae]